MKFLRLGLLIMAGAFIASCGSSGGGGGSSSSGGAATGQYNAEFPGIPTSTGVAPASIDESDFFIVVTESGEFSAMQAMEGEILFHLVGSVDVDDFADIETLTPGDEFEESILDFCYEELDADLAAWIDGDADGYIDGELQEEGLALGGLVCAATGEGEEIIEKGALVFVSSACDGEECEGFPPLILEATYIPESDAAPLGTDPLEYAYWYPYFGVDEMYMDVFDEVEPFDVPEEPDTESFLDGSLYISEIELGDGEFGSYECDMEGEVTSDGYAEYLVSGTLYCYSYGDVLSASVQPADEHEPDVEFQFNGIIAYDGDYEAAFSIEVPALNYANYVFMEDDD